ncbi:MAG: CARDB domain-containing protein, partial [candidate division WOR-3 bacterium]
MRSRMGLTRKGWTAILPLLALFVVTSAFAEDYIVTQNPDGTFTTWPPEGLPVVMEGPAPEKPVLPQKPPVAVDYTSAQNGNWGDTMTWSPRGIPGATDNVTINHNVTVDANQSCNNITIGTSGTLTCSGAYTLTVNGNWTNNGSTNLTNGTVTFAGSSATTIGGNNATTFYQVTIAKNALATTVTMNRAVTVSANTTTALQINTGTLVTNGQNLTVNGGTSARLVGTTTGKLDCTNGSTVTINYIYQWGLGYVSVSGAATTLNITRWDLANSGHRVDISAGTVNILSTAANALTLYTNNQGWGWYMTGGTLNIYGGITTNIGVWFQCSGTSVVKFVGTAAATVILQSSSSTFGNRWAFNDLRCEKTGSTATLLFRGGFASLIGFVSATTGLTVNSGNTVTLGGTFKPDTGYLFGNVTNNGTIVVVDTNSANSRHITVTGTFTNNGTFTLGPRVLVLGTGSAAGTVTNGSGATFSAVGTGLTDTACVTAASESYPYGFTVQSGATIAAQFATFRWMNSSGINVASGATVHATNNFSYCNFYHGSISGPMLKLENSQVIVMNQTNFSGSAGYNIEKLSNQGIDTVSGGGGTRWGEAYDNDPYDRVIWVVGADVGTSRIIAPVETIPYGTPVTPQAVVKNFGTVPAGSFKVRFEIGNVYTDSQTVSGLGPGDSAIVNFASWPADTAGPWATKCSTRLLNDPVPSNDRVVGSCFVMLTDVGPTRIVAPTGTIPYGTPVIPQAVVKNFGGRPQSFNVMFRIGTFYSSTKPVSNLGPGDSVVVNFDQWPADSAGTWPTKCSTMLAGDQRPLNDTVLGSVTVNLIDACPTQIVAPAPGSYVDSGTTITPRARFKNRGSNQASFYASFRILETGYSNTRLLVNIPAGRETLVSFNNWTVPGRGTYTLRCSTYLSGDQIRANDTLSGVVTGRVLDVAATAILRPPALVYINDVVTPQATVWNYGSEPAVFNLRFVIMDATDAIVYDTTEEVSLGVGATEDHLFTKTWVAAPVGQYTCFAKASLPGDLIPANDSTGKPFRVSSRYTPGWKEMKQVPLTPSGKQVK